MPRDRFNDFQAMLKPVIGDTGSALHHQGLRASRVQTNPETYRMLARRHAAGVIPVDSGPAGVG
jgi:hypothetical protein